MMSSTNDDDPFLQVQADALTLLSHARSLFSSYIRIRSLASSASSPELLQARAEVESTLTDLSNDVADLFQSVKAIEQDPYRYGVEIEEVASRRRVVMELEGEIEDIREELAKGLGGAATGRPSGRPEQLPPPSAFASDAAGHGDYEAFEHQRQLEMMNEQDEALDGVSRTVGNLRQQANDMGRELEEQGELLTDVDKLADRVENRLQKGAKRMGALLKRNEDTMSSCCIGVLIFILIVFLVLLLVL